MEETQTHPLAKKSNFPMIFLVEKHKLDILGDRNNSRIFRHTHFVLQ